MDVQLLRGIIMYKRKKNQPLHQQTQLLFAAMMAWMIFQSAYDTDVLDLDSAAKALDRMKKDCIFYKRAYEDNSQTPMWQYMLEYFVERYAQMAKQNLDTDTLDTQILYSIRLYCYGTLGMTREWVLTDNITPARTAAQMMLESMPETLKQIFPVNKTAAINLSI